MNLWFGDRKLTFQHGYAKGNEKANMELRAKNQGKDYVSNKTMFKELMKMVRSKEDFTM